MPKTKTAMVIIVFKLEHPDGWGKAPIESTASYEEPGHWIEAQEKAKRLANWHNCQVRMNIDGSPQGNYVSPDMVSTESIRIVAGWRLDHEPTGWKLWHPGSPAGTPPVHLARIGEIDGHGLYAKDRSLQTWKYLTLFCAHHERQEGKPTQTNADGLTVFGAQPHCKWCGRDWGRIEEMAAAVHAQA